jgi:hypothetical protein
MVNIILFKIDYLRVFDENLPKRPWDNFHFVEFHELMKGGAAGDNKNLSFAVQSLLEIPDQYHHVCELGLVKRRLRSKSKSKEIEPDSKGR